MTFREWLKSTNLSISAFARLMETERNTVIRMLKDKAPSPQIRIKLMARTKKMSIPLTYELQEEIFNITKKQKKATIFVCHCEECPK